MRRPSNTADLYFLTLTIVDWVPIFAREEYKKYLVENLDFCQINKGLKVFSYVIMFDHIHMVAKVEQDKRMSDFLRDFKSYTAKGLYKLIKYNADDLRKDWMIEIFDAHGQQNNLNDNFQIWQNGSYPTLLDSNEIIDQKVEYIHNNPVRAGWVEFPERFVYSSANPQSPLTCFEF